MNPEGVPDSVPVPLKTLIELAIEHWRLSRALAASPAGPAGPARHALRKMADMLQGLQLEVRSLEGQPFDAGLAARVVHTEDDAALPEGQVTIDETVSPMLLWRGQVIRSADIVTRRGTRR